MKFFNAKRPVEVIEILDSLSKDYQLESSEVDLMDSLGRRLKNDLVSNVNVPEFNRSTVDGYAVKALDTRGATTSIPILLDLKGQVDMGRLTDLTVNADQCVYVPTGGMVPEGADAMLRIEDSESIDDKTIAVNKSISHGQDIIYMGDDIAKGKTILKSNHIIGPHDIGVLAALGFAKVTVYDQVKVSVYSTGDEIIPVDAPMAMGKIKDINGYVLKAKLKDIGMSVVRHAIIKDDAQALKEHLSKALVDSDVILLSGGSSVGLRDFTHQVIESFDHGKVLVHGITVKPGKPTIIGRVGHKVLVGLPGHPVSSIMVFSAFIEPFLKKIAGYKDKQTIVSGVLTSNVHSDPGKRTYQMVNLDGDKLVPFYGKSGMISLLAGADGYIILDESIEGIEKGTRVDVHLFD